MLMRSQLCHSLEFPRSSYLGMTRGTWPQKSVVTNIQSASWIEWCQ